MPMLVQRVEAADVEADSRKFLLDSEAIKNRNL